MTNHPGLQKGKEERDLHLLVPEIIRSIFHLDHAKEGFSATASSKSVLPISGLQPS
jgi:hypothetical protein